MTGTRISERRRAAAEHAANVPVNRKGRLRTGKGYCFGGALCDYVAAQPDYRGGWDRDRSGRWHFVDEEGRPHETHMPLDVRHYLGIDGPEAAAVNAGNDDLRIERSRMAELFGEQRLVTAVATQFRSAERRAQNVKDAQADAARRGRRDEKATRGQSKQTGGQRHGAPVSPEERLPEPVDHQVYAAVAG